MNSKSETEQARLTEIVSTMNNTIQQAPDGIATDPAPAPIDVHRERLTAIINTATATALDDCRKLREQQDRVMRALTDERENLLLMLDKHLQQIESTMSTNAVIFDALNQLEKRIVSAPRTIPAEAPPQPPPMPGSPYAPKRH